MSKITTSPTPLTLLFTCAGRRVELVQAFRAAAKRLGVALRIVATDQTPTAPALICADHAEITPPIRDTDYIPALLNIVKRHRIAALVPTIDTDLLPISSSRDQFSAAGCMAMIAAPDVIQICRDKVQTYQFLMRCGIDTPQTYTADEIRALPSRTFPYFIKPRHGSASAGVHKLADETDLTYYLAKVPSPIVQEFVEGQEYTLDVYVGLTGEPRCVVPRARWQVRGGEVSKGVVVKETAIMNAGRSVVEKLGKSCRGLVTLQCIVTKERRIRFIEINPRFGGGAPIGIAAGADYPAWLIQELLGAAPPIAFDGFAHGLCATRYDWAAYVQLDSTLAPRVAPPTHPFPELQ